MTAFRLPPDREARLRQRMAGQPDAPPSIQALRRAKALALLDHLLLHPTVSIKRVAQQLCRVFVAPVEIRVRPVQDRDVLGPAVLRKQKQGNKAEKNHPEHDDLQWLLMG